MHTSDFLSTCGYLYLLGFNNSNPSLLTFPVDTMSYKGKWGYMLKSPLMIHGVFGDIEVTKLWSFWKNNDICKACISGCFQLPNIECRLAVKSQINNENRNRIRIELE